MKRINWKKKVKEIPSRVQIAPKVFYDVTWQKEITDTKGNHLYGVTDLTNKIITIQLDLSPKLTVETYIHELGHAFSEEFGLDLTETQVLAMEPAIPYMIRSNNIFQKESK